MELAPGTGGAVLQKSRDESRLCRLGSPRHKAGLLSNLCAIPP